MHKAFLSLHGTAEEEGGVVREGGSVKVHRVALGWKRVC